MVSQAFPADSTLSQAESTVSQTGIPQAVPVVRRSARLRALHASQSNNSQAVSSQVGNTPLADSANSQLVSKASQLGSSQANVPQATSSTSSQEARAPLPLGITVPRVLPPGRNLTQSGSSTYLANL